MSDKKNEDVEWMEFDPSDPRVVEEKPKPKSNWRNLLRSTNHDDSSDFLSGCAWVFILLLCIFFFVIIGNC